MKPALLVILILAGGGLSYWSFDTQAEFETVIKEKIEPGEVLPFETKIKPVRTTVRRVDITFKKGLEP